MARMKAEPKTKLATLEEAETALARLCRVEAEIQIAEGIGKRRAVKLAEDTAERVRPLQERQAELVRALTAFVEDNQDLFPGKAKSLKLTHGKLGLRHQNGKLQPVAKNKKEAEVVKARAIELLEKQHPDCVKTVKSLDLKALRKAGEKVWAKVKFALVGAKDQPYAETAPSVVADLADKLKPKEV